MIDIQMFFLLAGEKKKEKGQKEKDDVYKEKDIKIEKRLEKERGKKVEKATENKGKYRDVEKERKINRNKRDT